jgi:hypothetical protein
MEDTKGKKKENSKSEDQEVDRRKFIEKSARDMGACGFAIYELAKTIKNDIIQEVVDEIKDVIRRS